MTTVPLFVELCAGTAALSLRLHKDGARPPVSRMGAKTGYADAILRVLGLHPGQRAERYLWCEPDPGVRLLLHAYRDATLAKAAATIIRSWKDEDPRALWERLRAEGPPKLPEGEVDAGEVARWQLLGAWAFRKGEPESGSNAGYVGVRPSTATEHGSLGRTAADEARMTERMPTDLPATIAPDARDIDPREVARYAQIVASNRLINTAWSDTEGRWINTGNGGATFGGTEFATPPGRTAEGLDAAPADLPAVVAPDAREVDPREVARWAVVGAWSFRAGQPDSGFNQSEAIGHPQSCKYPRDCTRLSEDYAASPALPATIAPDAREVDPREVARAVITGQWAYRRGSPESGFAEARTGSGSGEGHGDTTDMLASRWAQAPVMPAALIHPDARDIDPPALPPGTVVFIDPPYVNTTSYAHDLPRPEVVALARRWAEAGATVTISEAEPIPELVAEGWYSVEITGERIGQKRTFSKQQREWLTLNRRPLWVPPVQGSLFG